MSNQLITDEQPQLPMVSLAQPTGAAVERVANSQNKLRDRLIMARSYPRDEDEALRRALKACERSSFAQIAIWEKDVGGGKMMKGPGVRLAEEIYRHWGNLDDSTEIIHTDERGTTIKATVLDLETNTSRSAERYVPHVEYSKAKGNRNLSSPDEIYKKTASATSKAWRDCVFRLVPRDVIDELYESCQKTLQRVEDLGPTIKKLYMSFAAQGVSPDDLVAYLAKKADAWNSEDVGQLRVLYRSMLDGETSADEIKTAGKNRASGSTGTKTSTETQSPQEPNPVDVNIVEPAPTTSTTSKKGGKKNQSTSDVALNADSGAVDPKTATTPGPGASTSTNNTAQSVDSSNDPKSTSAEPSGSASSTDAGITATGTSGSSTDAISAKQKPEASMSEETGNQSAKTAPSTQDGQTDAGDLF